MTRPLQPHKGASETLRVVVTDVHGLPLQPHKGASETLKRASSKIEARLLQPHKGASETGMVSSKALDMAELQPHKGASETRSWRSMYHPNCYFNPTRVRLKLVRFELFGLTTRTSTPQGCV